MGTKPGKGYKPDVIPFQSPETFTAAVQEAIKVAANGKAVGADELSSEALQVDPVHIATLLTAV